MTSAPFSTIPIDLGKGVLAPLEDADAHSLAAACAAIDPWKRMDYAVDVLERYFQTSDPASHRFALTRDGALAGAVVLRYPWLKGPYLEFLAVLPEHQGNGLGRAVLAWMENEVAASDRNLWVLASDFNELALAFYERFGFEPVAPLPDVAAQGFTEILLRKRLKA